MLRNNGSDTFTLAGDSAFTFTTLFATGGAYAVSVHAQRATQTCTLTNRSGCFTLDEPVSQPPAVADISDYHQCIRCQANEPGSAA